MTVLTRDASKDGGKLPAGVALKQVDYTSVAELTEVLKGQDAVVSTLGSFAVGGQTPLADAALAAGVKRFIPSEFGVNTRKAIGTPLGGVLGAKIKLVDHLDELAKANPGFSWTGISIGLFFDWVRIGVPRFPCHATRDNPRRFTAVFSDERVGAQERLPRLQPQGEDSHGLRLGQRAVAGY